MNTFFVWNTSFSNYPQISFNINFILIHKDSELTKEAVTVWTISKVCIWVEICFDSACSLTEESCYNGRPFNNNLVY